MLSAIRSEWTPLTHHWCHQRRAESLCTDRHDETPHRDRCDEVFAASYSACRPFWKHLDQSNRIDRFEPSSRDAQTPVRPIATLRPSVTSISPARVGEVSPVRTPELRTRVEQTYRMTKDLGTGRVIDVVV